MKQIKLLTDQPIQFLQGKREIPLSVDMPLPLAERIAAKYPGQYLEVIEVSETQKKSPENGQAES